MMPWLPRSPESYPRVYKNYWLCLDCNVGWYDTRESVCWWCGTRDWTVMRYPPWGSADLERANELRAILRERGKDAVRRP
jgi:hypothetical protein